MTWLTFVIAAMFALPQVGPRIAIVSLQGDQGSEVTLLLEQVVSKFNPVDPDLTRRAVKGASYSGSLNMSRSDAKSLGESIGCDYYFAGLAKIVRRIGTRDDTYFESLAGVYLIETRTGRLVKFTMVRERAPTDSEASGKMLKSLKAHLIDLEQAISAAFKRSQDEARTLPPADALEVIDLEGGSTPLGVSAPVFYERLKPEYTDDAASIDLVATVEISAIFGTAGRVESSEVLRWAGFGLDESALATVRKLRFKPAMKQGKPISVRGLVRYNFKKPPSAAEREAEANKLRESIKQSTQKP